MAEPAVIGELPQGDTLSDNFRDTKTRLFYGLF